MKTYQNVEMRIVLCNSEDVITSSYQLPEVEIFSLGEPEKAFND